MRMLLKSSTGLSLVYCDHRYDAKTERDGILSNAKFLIRFRRLDGNHNSLVR